MIIEYDRRWLREILPKILKNVEKVIIEGDIFDDVLLQMKAIVIELQEELKRIKIFKFKMYLEGDGEYLTNTVDQELKTFISNSKDMQKTMRKLWMGL